MPGRSSDEGIPDETEQAHLSHEEAIAVVRRALREIEFGSVLLKVHEGEVVGIETSTKVRLRR
jgi:hypothetical protein